jgi:hypothetical protein
MGGLHAQHVRRRDRAHVVLEAHPDVVVADWMHVFGELLLDVVGSSIAVIDFAARCV